MKTVYTTGVFDILHKGHFNILTKAAGLGDKLVVGIQDDFSVQRSKGRLPTLSQDERQAQLLALPFIHDVIIYSGTDQVPHLERLAPQIMVQGDDWLSSADRTTTLDYLKKRKIRLVLLPYTQDISSTEIKRRVLKNQSPFRKDDKLLLKHFKFIKTTDLWVYELPEEKKVLRLMEEIKESGILKNPISVGTDSGNNIVIDGNNRLTALKRLGVKWAPCVVFDYKDKSQVELTSNVHYVNSRVPQLLEVIESLGLAHICRPIEDLPELMEENYLFYIADHLFCYPVFNVLSSMSANSVINTFVSTYINELEVSRLSEFGQSSGTRIIFNRHSVEDIIAMSKKGFALQNGITWHKTAFSVARINVPISLLNLEKPDAEEFMKSRISSKRIRMMSGNTYLCDE